MLIHGLLILVVLWSVLHFCWPLLRKKEHTSKYSLNAYAAASCVFLILYVQGFAQDFGEGTMSDVLRALILIPLGVSALIATAGVDIFRKPELRAKHKKNMHRTVAALFFAPIVVVILYLTMGAYEYASPSPFWWVFFPLAYSLWLYALFAEIYWKGVQNHGWNMWETSTMWSERLSYVCLFIYLAAIFAANFGSVWGATEGYFSHYAHWLSFSNTH